MSADPRLEQLLAHPAIWRGRNAARTDTLPTGFPSLDARLPGQGWPQHGLVEILISRLGVGELHLLLPVLAQLTSRPTARWCACIAPPAYTFTERGLRPAGRRHDFRPLTLYAPALAAHGVCLARMLVVHAESPLWPCEQALRSGSCDVVLAFLKRVQPRALRRLQLAAAEGRTLGFLFRALGPRTLDEPSAAVLRLAVQPSAGGVRVTVLKSRGGVPGAVELSPFARAP